MICPKCSKELMNDSEFCNYCGEKIVADLDQVSDPNMPGRKRKLIAVFIPVVIALIACIFIFVYRSLSKRTYEYNSIDIVRYLSSQLSIDDITNKGDVSDPSFGNMNTTTWIDSVYIDSSYLDTKNKIISFDSDHKAEKYCNNSSEDYNKYRYGNIVLELSSSLDDDAVSEYKNTMANIDHLSEEDTKKNRFTLLLISIPLFHL